MIKEAYFYNYYQSKINDVCEQKCKSKQQWKDEEILFTKSKYYKARYKGAEELCERYQKRLYNFQKQEDNNN